MATEDHMEGLTVTVRLIRSFQHKNLKNVVFHKVHPDMTVDNFMDMVRKDIQTRPGLPPPFRKHAYDTLKLEFKAHCNKTNNPVINTGDDEKLMLKSGATLRESGVENETEISFFKREEYENFVENPVTKW
ncbi:PREDICTED: UPF0538 protein C2orf76 homolog [Branchiostoma belcheri]|uniref:UPF0538 protein C2orf76 homolog n=1 Tax=Branchiostoma belcheri TaxID=7741 RepID=A0A6P4Z930_BRABE|nr:PREDICTED: UPF0538 protein C2orf76 homolog [Branchiostoma belcheri]XP_019630394.1 PREDICTED: UPF0538 protein C2orf76 homolog [Branchiostoma belcheri]XP_019630395.1 PREDICTED: UPF0538 protein C2orf76 homolog [Branchiostoma belcheri]